MIIKKNDNYTLITSEKSDSSFSDFFIEFEKNHSNLITSNIFIQLSDNLSIKDEDFFVFLKHADSHRENGTTFVIIHNSLNIDKFPETFNIAPTLIEAEDILEMENIERDLGF